MNTHDEDEIRKEFQLERLIFFSDAVFAIIITIMILDVKLPEALVHPSETESKEAFLKIMPKLGGYAVSFAVIGNFWMRHLRVFSFLKDYNKQLIILNLLFLFSVSLFPFALSFSFNSSYIMQYTWGLYTYLSIIYLTYFTQTLLIGYLILNKEELCLKPDEIEMALQWKIRRLSYFIIPIFFTFMITAIHFHLSAYIILGAMISYRLVILYLKKKWYRNYKQDRVTIISFFRRKKSPAHQIQSGHK